MVSAPPMPFRLSSDLHSLSKGDTPPVGIAKVSIYNNIENSTPSKIFQTKELQLKTSKQKSYARRVTRAYLLPYLSRMKKAFV